MTKEMRTRGGVLKVIGGSINQDTFTKDLVLIVRKRRFVKKSRRKLFVFTRSLVG